MNKTKRVGLATTITAFAMAACTLATLGMAKGMASADEVEPAPVPAEQGWYIVGNGAGTLKDCSWTEYLADYKLDGKESKTGIFTKKDVTLYEGDAFKVLYANGEWAWPSDSNWTSDVMAQYSNVSAEAGYFVDGGLGNIQVTKEGQGIYDLTLRVTSTKTTLTLTKTSTVVDPIVQEEMYVVGTLKGYKDCNWPGAIDVKACCPALTLNEATQKWTTTLELKAGDEFKVYNLANNAYFPSGIANNCVIAEDGNYYIEYGVAAPSFIVKNLDTGKIVYGG